MSLNYAFMVQDIPVVLAALPRTLGFALCAYMGAILLAFLAGICILRNIPLLKQLVIALNTLLKCVPLMVQLLLCFYAIPYLLQGLDGFLGYAYNPKNPSYFAFALVAFAFNYGAYMTDVVLSSYRAVDKGQLEAAYSVGMSAWQGLAHIVLPQALVIAIPNLTNYFIWLFKASSLASLVNVFELLATARMSTANNYAILEGYIVAAGIYWLVCVLAEKGFALLDKKMNEFRHDLPTA